MFQLSEKQKIAHLLRRFGFGASEAELEYYSKGGLNGAIDKLLNCEDIPESFTMPIEDFARDNGQVVFPILGSYWTMKLISTRRPLLEKMTLFWHNHFATGGDKVVQTMTMYQQNETLREFALGSFKELLMAVAKDPAMLLYLDGQENIKGRPNENFAREVMELFTLGVGNYSEKDVQEASRAFTGWSFRRSGPGGGNRGRLQYMFKPVLHDDGVKTVLGKTGNLGGEDVIDHLCSMPRTAEFLTEKLWNWFVYPNPSKETVQKFAAKFAKSDLNIKALLREIMTSPEFYSEKAFRNIVKNPVDFCVSTLRSLGIGEQVAAQLENMRPEARKVALAPGLSAWQTMKGQGMHLFFPPDVSGWKPGENWITSATMVERINWAARLMGTARGPVGRYPVYTLLAADPTGYGIVSKLCSVFDAPITGQKLAKIAEFTNKQIATEGLTQQNANKIAGEVCKLIFGSPEFQFA
jgi:hypothetical protein